MLVSKECMLVSWKNSTTDARPAWSGKSSLQSSRMISCLSRARRKQMPCPFTRYDQLEELIQIPGYVSHTTLRRWVEEMAAWLQMRSPVTRVPSIAVHRHALALE